MNKFVTAFFLLTSCTTLSAQTKIDQGEKFKEVINLIENYYTDSVHSEKLVDAAINKVLEELDPHSSYILAKDVKRNDEPLVANFEGVGVTFQLLKDTIFILEVIPGGPSEKVGIHAGDKIIKINDTVQAGVKIETAGVVSRLRGNKGTKVKVDILRKGESSLLAFTIMRDKIPIFSVDASYMASPTTGYIKLSKFSASTMAEFLKDMEKLRGQGMQNLILDLEGNLGGYLYTAVDLCNQFLEGNQLLVYTQGLHSAKQPYYSDGKGTFKEGKLVVLIDEGSASAAEITAGCVQDQDRGLLVGRRTWGKGLVQKPYQLMDGSLIRLTNAHYYIPSGRCIQRSYAEGKKDYYDEYSRRLKSGELFGADTVHFPDSLMFHTKNKRKVYGGGGVVPDVYVPIDTSMNSLYFNQMVRKGLINNFCLEYVDKNRAQINGSYPNVDSFINRFSTDENILNQLYAYGEKDSVYRTPKDSVNAKSKDDWKKSLPAIKTQIKALIARNVYDNTAFYRVLNQLNNTYLKALEVMNSDKFNILNPPVEEKEKGKKKKK